MATFSTTEQMEAGLGASIRSLRLNQNIDQKTLAERAGISVRALKNLEGGQGSTMKSFLSVLRALGRSSWLELIAVESATNFGSVSNATGERQRATRRKVVRSKA